MIVRYGAAIAAPVRLFAIVAFLGVAFSVVAVGTAVAGAPGETTSVGADGSEALSLNESYVDSVRANTALKTDSVESVFAYVLSSLKSEVFVYPTENYYYFDFVQDGIDYTGNIRLSVVDRDKGFVHFNFYKTFTRWRRDLDYRYRKFGPDDGVTVEKRGDFLYAVSYRGVERVFHLNDRLPRKAPKGVLGPDDRYIGPIFDESGIRFFLVYNKAAKVFHYILDETVPVADQLYPSQFSDAILMGWRTGFAFYKDGNLDRKILIGVYEENSNTNNFLDGPFDQLPDNYLAAGALRDALIDMDPSLTNKIDAFGFWSNDARYLIGPYLYYSSEDQLLMFDNCARSGEMTAPDYYRCFVAEDPASPVSSDDDETQDGGRDSERDTGGKTKIPIPRAK